MDVGEDVVDLYYDATTKNQDHYNPRLNWGPNVTGQCAAYANDALKQAQNGSGFHTYSSEDIGGHAWTRMHSGKHPSKMIFYGYESEDYDRDNYSPKASDDRNFAAAERLKAMLDYSKLDKNEVYMVNMFAKESPHRKAAWKNGLGGITGSHTGNLYYDYDDETWKVNHGAGYWVHTDNLSDLLGSKGHYGVTAISLVPRAQPVASKLIKNTITKVNPKLVPKKK